MDKEGGETNKGAVVGLLFEINSIPDRAEPTKLRTQLAPTERAEEAVFNKQVVNMNRRVIEVRYKTCQRRMS